MSAHPEPVEVLASSLTRWLPPCLSCGAGVHPVLHGDVWVWMHYEWEADEHCGQPEPPNTFMRVLPPGEGMQFVEHQPSPPAQELMAKVMQAHLPLPLPDDDTVHPGWVMCMCHATADENGEGRTLFRGPIDHRMHVAAVIDRTLVLTFAGREATPDEMRNATVRLSARLARVRRFLGGGTPLDASDVAHLIRIVEGDPHV